MNKKLQKKIDEGREYRAMSFDIVDGVEDRKIVQGYATTFNEPYYLYSFENDNGEKITVYEQVSDRAFDNTDMSDVIFQYDHVGRVFARLSNGTMTLEPDERGLKTTADLGGTEIGRQLYEEIKNGYTTKMSFGFSVDKESIGNHPNGRDYIRTIDSVRKLYDVSAVSMPQNEFTSIQAERSLNGVIEDMESERIQQEIRKQELEEKRNALTQRLKNLGGKNGN